ncbi:MAG: DUF5620 domain-containing protein [Ruminococcus sp.]|nr:DUF5620 domain-containing protein [Ruminococcus sp.]
MKRKNMSARLKASLMSFIMAASCVPAAMTAVAVSDSPAVDVTDTTDTTDKDDTNKDDTGKDDTGKDDTGKDDTGKDDTDKDNTDKDDADKDDDQKGVSIAVGETYEGFTADVAESGLKTINITFTPDFTGSFSCGFGIGTNKSPYWLEYDAVKGFIDSKSGTVKIAATEIACKKGEPVTIGFDLSKLDLKYDPSTEKYPGKFEFRNYYAGESEGTITIDKIEANGEVVKPPAPDKPDNPDNPYTKPVTNVPHNNKTTSGNNWSFKDNGNGTATISSTVARQIDFSENPIILTQGYDEDSYAADGITPTEDDPINSHKFKYSDFGLTDMNGVTIESLTAIIETEEDADVFMYGGGLNVKQASPADTEYAKREADIPGKEKAGYWYNDCGEDQLKEFEEAGVKFEIKPSTGATIVEAGNYIQAYWEVPAKVQPYTNTKVDDEISFQYWYGTKAEQEEDAAEPALLETVKLTGAVITYTKEIIVPYTDSVSTKVSQMLEHADEKKNALHMSYSDLGIDETMDVYAIRFDVSANSKVDKLVYNTGTSVTEDAETEEEYWYQEKGDYCVLDAGEKAEIMWIMPAAVANDRGNYVSTDGEVYFGYYYGEADAISIDNVEVYYNIVTTTTTTTKSTTATTTATTTTATTTSKPTTSKSTTTATTTGTTTTTTTQPAKPSVTLWGDANVDKKVSIADAVLIMQSLSNPDEYKLSEQGIVNADVVDNGEGVAPSDALAIQAVDLQLIEQSELPITSEKLNNAF